MHVLCFYIYTSTAIFTMLLDSNKESYTHLLHIAIYQIRSTIRTSNAQTKHFSTLHNEPDEIKRDRRHQMRYCTALQQGNTISTRHRVRSKHARPRHDARSQANHDIHLYSFVKGLRWVRAKGGGDTNHAGAGSGSSRRGRGGGVAREGGDRPGPGQGCWRCIRAGEGEG
jgi:hypothetical protein